MRAVGTVPELIHAVTHDIGEPVREILGFAKLLADRAPAEIDAHFWDDLGHVASGAARTRRMLDALCEYIRVDELEPEPGLLDLDRLAADLRTHLSELDDAPAHELTCAMSGTVSTLPAVARLVVTELATNAARFGAGDDGVARVTVTATVENGGLMVTVSDSGPGIAADALERAMQLFQRVHPRSELDTLGAGLAIARRRVDRCGGRLELRAVDAGTGLRAVLWLPTPLIDLRDDIAVIPDAASPATSRASAAVVDAAPDEAPAPLTSVDGPRAVAAGSAEHSHRQAEPIDDARGDAARGDAPTGDAPAPDSDPDHLTEGDLR